MDFESVAAQATEQFHDCRKLLIALGNETRQAIITTLIEDECKGMSHHLKVLLDAEVIGVTPEGTKNFYWLKLSGAWHSLVSLVQNIEMLRTMEGKPDEQKIHQKRNP